MNSLWLFHRMEPEDLSFLLLIEYEDLILHGESLRWQFGTRNAIFQALLELHFLGLIEPLRLYGEQVDKLSAHH